MTSGYLAATLLATALAAGVAARTATDPLALSIFEPDGQGSRWVRLEPLTGRRKVIARFPVGLPEVSVYWHPGLREAVVNIHDFHLPGSDMDDGPITEESLKRYLARSSRDGGAWIVRVQDGRKVPLPQHPSKGLDVVGYRANGSLIGVTSEWRSQAEGGWLHRYWRLAGPRWEPLAAAGTPVRPGQDDFVRDVGTDLDDLPTDTIDGAPGTVGPVDDGTLGPARTPDPFVSELDARLPRGYERLRTGWSMVRTPFGDLIALQSMGGHFQILTKPVFFAAGPGLEALPGLRFNDPKSDQWALDVLRARIRERYLIIHDGPRVPTRPRLYDVAARKLVWRSDTATSAAFWPRGK